MRHRFSCRWQHVCGALLLALLPCCLQASAQASTAIVEQPVHMADEHTMTGRAENAVAAWIQDMGWWGPVVIAGIILLAGVGIPVSEEILVVPSGFLVARGLFPLWWTALLIWVAVVLADLIWMLVVRRWAHVLLQRRLFRRMFHPRRILEIKHMLDRRGVWVIVLGRILPATRTPTITAAGLAHMPIKPFMLGETIGATKSVAWQMTLGWLIATGLQQTSSQAHLRDAMLIALAVLLLVVAIWWHRSRHSTRRPRATMQWLRAAMAGKVAH